MSFYLGSSLAIVVNDIKSVMEVFVQKSPDFASRISTPSADAISFGGKDRGLSQYGPTWKLHRKIASKALRHYLQGDALEQRDHNTLYVVFKEMETEKRQFEPVST